MLVSEDLFVDLVEDVLDRRIVDNPSQMEAVLSSIDEDQFIVAGPGSGKTTVLVLKILKYLVVDGVEADSIMVTTFTKKAAREIKNRIDGWAKILNDTSYVDVNPEGIVIGTLDSIAEDLLSKREDFDVIDNFASSAMMMQRLLYDERNNDKRLKQFIKDIVGHHASLSTSDINNQINSIRQRLYYDLVDVEAIRCNAKRDELVYTIIDEYSGMLSSRDIYDYPILEYKFSELLTDEPSIFDKLRVLLVDEYQDTNYLQEQIYFKLAGYVKANNGNITVVGDDDQALYRFRGANVKLFTDYATRIKKALSIVPKEVFLQQNYRATSNIIDFTNDYITLDDAYVKSRSKNKPQTTKTKVTPDGLPVMGLFRNNIEELSTDLSELMYKLKINEDIEITRNNKTLNIKTDKENPSIALLTNSPKEISAYNKKRLPYYIRESIQYKDEDMLVFNPRGQNIESTEIVSLICGLILVSIDEKAKFQNTLENIPPLTEKTLKLWRKKAELYIEEENITFTQTPEEINLQDLVNDIVEQLEPLTESNNENKIYGDIITETIKQTNNAISTDGLLSSKQIFWHILIPIATGAIELDDDMFDVDLEDNINIMSIHQSKGLEFDVVIVDVGSDIYNNQSSSAFKRFPRNGGTSYNIENYLKRYSNADIDDSDTRGIDEAFNDLIRKYYVAYTRSKTMLILVGLTNMKDGYRGDFQNNIKIENVATGWSRDKTWHWYGLENLTHI